MAPGGTVHAVGMPATTTLDLTGLWHRETNLRGCYAYERDDFATATALTADLDLGRALVGRRAVEPRVPDDHPVDDDPEEPPR